MNRKSMINYILAWENEKDGITERLDTMTYSELHGL